jgi:hypothetical protein
VSNRNSAIESVGQISEDNTCWTNSRA